MQKLKAIIREYWFFMMCIVWISVGSICTGYWTGQFVKLTECSTIYYIGNPWIFCLIMLALSTYSTYIWIRNIVHEISRLRLSAELNRSSK